VISKLLSFSTLAFATGAFVSTGSAFAGAPAIGIVTASGHVTVERSQVWGNSTLFDGATVETTSASSELSLRSGVRVQLGAASRARVWENRVALERGVGQVAGPSSFELDTAGLKIRAGGVVGNDTGRVRVAVNDRIEVSALTGVARVTNGAGLLLASIPAGRSMSFAMNAGQAGGSVTRTGCQLFKDGHFIIQDENTQEVVELNGRDLAPSVGNRVEAVGTAGPTKPAVSIATSILNVTRITIKSQGGCLSAAAALNAQAQVPANAAATPADATTPASKGGTSAPRSESGGGMSTGAKVAIIAGVAGGGAGAAIALAGHKSSTSP
jgi:hypothetical protein